jgi:hypothetical protein
MALSSPGVEDRNEWSYSFTSLYACMVCIGTTFYLLNLSNIFLIFQGYYELRMGTKLVILIYFIVYLHFTKKQL